MVYLRFYYLAKYSIRSVIVVWYEIFLKARGGNVHNMGPMEKFHGITKMEISTVSAYSVCSIFSFFYSFSIRKIHSGI